MSAIQKSVRDNKRATNMIDYEMTSCASLGFSSQPWIELEFAETCSLQSLQMCAYMHPCELILLAVKLINLYYQYAVVNIVLYCLGTHGLIADVTYSSQTQYRGFGLVGDIEFGWSQFFECPENLGTVHIVFDKVTSAETVHIKFSAPDNSILELFLCDLLAFQD